MHWLKDISIVIFDMDGTLYQDYTFMERYIQKMMEGGFPETEIQETVDKAYDILEGKKQIRLGFLYDREQLAFYSHQNLKPSVSYDWDGIETEMVHSEENPLSYIGDPWGIVELMAVKKNIAAGTVRRAFTNVRKEMLTEAYCIAKRTDLFEEIKKLTGHRTILMTNSPLPTGQEFVDFLELGDVFDEIYIDGKKPGGIQNLMDKFLAEGYQPYEILSIGDNPWNDLYPIHKSGGHTCLISQYEHQDTTNWSVSVETVDELVGLVEQLNGKAVIANGKEESYG
ncbi:HAD family hydrolase [Planococcus salinus]|uniref:HAD family hydrolase n=1 Tax=Planococcus salinus TaxID=1848460 RepID=A0A3M8P864_9BACL|nr:HAD family hydrolase [Planococcus salinus]RNF39853.1 HAD family hydrolase [Planococcus salinus]